MNNFWPKRSSPQGFSIEKLAKQSRLKMNISKLEHTNYFEGLNPNIEKDTQIIPGRKSSSRINLSEIHHWANRSFSEYSIPPKDF